MGLESWGRLIAAHGGQSGEIPVCLSLATKLWFLDFKTEHWFCSKNLKNASAARVSPDEVAALLPSNGANLLLA